MTPTSLQAAELMAPAPPQWFDGVRHARHPKEPAVRRRPSDLSLYAPMPDHCFLYRPDGTAIIDCDAFGNAIKPNPDKVPSPSSLAPSALVHRLFGSASYAGIFCHIEKLCHWPKACADCVCVATALLRIAYLPWAKVHPRRQPSALHP
eukprot:SAG31_NODE_5490_length_2504_cov_1.607069_3_plen_149_part_00